MQNARIFSFFFRPAFKLTDINYKSEGIYLSRTFFLSLPVGGGQYCLLNSANVLHGSNSCRKWVCVRVCVWMCARNNTSSWQFIQVKLFWFIICQEIIIYFRWLWTVLKVWDHEIRFSALHNLAQRKKIARFFFHGSKNVNFEHG